jgi:hypothetical protein
LTTLQKYIKSEADVDGMLAVGNGLLKWNPICSTPFSTGHKKSPWKSET